MGYRSLPKIIFGVVQGVTKINENKTNLHTNLVQTWDQNEKKALGFVVGNLFWVGSLERESYTSLTR
jgi:hypothetical protein